MDDPKAVLRIAGMPLETRTIEGWSVSELGDFPVKRTFIAPSRANGLRDDKALGRDKAILDTFNQFGWHVSLAMANGQEVSVEMEIGELSDGCDENGWSKMRPDGSMSLKVKIAAPQAPVSE